MNRRNFLKIAGIGAVAPTVVAKALIEKPAPLIAGEIGLWDGIPIYSTPRYIIRSYVGPTQAEIQWSPIKRDPFTVSPNLFVELTS